MDNLLDPVVLFFVLGLLAGGAKSDLRLPESIYKALSIFLLLAIGLKGGLYLSQTPISAVWLPTLGALGLGVLLPLLAYPLARVLGGLSRDDAAAIAAHYGSVSAVTFAVAGTFLDRLGVPYEAFVTLLLVLMEIPAIAVGVLLARLGDSPTAASPKGLVHEVFFNRSVFLLIGGVIIGSLAGADRLAPVGNVFFGGFKGALALFLLEMGVVAAQKLSDLKKAGVFLVGFAIVFPLLAGTLGAAVGAMCGLSLGGTMILATLSASASYIAAPAACHIAIPKANPTFYVTASLGVTFPFNLTVGIPVYYTLAKTLHPLF